jgi:hypothetical protein
MHAGLQSVPNSFRCFVYSPETRQKQCINTKNKRVKGFKEKHDNKKGAERVTLALTSKDVLHFHHIIYYLHVSYASEN